MRLPREVAPRQPVDVPPPQRPGFARRVLVIEDNVDAAESLKEVLELNEHCVELASSGPEGLAKASAFHPDVVLCDIGLPGMSGYEVARALRAEPSLRSPYLVALSGYASPDDAQRAQAAGFDRHVAKPLEPSALERVLELAP